MNKDIDDFVAVSLHMSYMLSESIRSLSTVALKGAQKRTASQGGTKNCRIHALWRTLLAQQRSSVGRLGGCEMRLVCFFLERYHHG